MVALPQAPEDSPTVKAIYRTYEAREAGAPWRGHLGGSVIGRECSRALWYGFRWCTESNFSGRLLRLFQTGHLEEPRIVADLRAIGCTVHEVNPGTGEQFRYTLHGGHFGGSFDGVALGLPEAPKTWHLCEMKTHNAKSFAAVKKHGVQKSKPEHYAQMQAYMGMGGLTRALYVARCKNTDALYTERIKYAAKDSKALQARALQIIDSTEPLTKAGGPDSFVCKWCDHRSICHGGALPMANCRTCAHATPISSGDGAVWMCGQDNEADPQQQREGCPEHLYIPALVPAEPIGADDDWVHYRAEDGREFINAGADAFPARDVATYGSIELRAGIATAGTEAVEAARSILGGEVVSELTEVARALDHEQVAALMKADGERYVMGSADVFGALVGMGLMKTVPAHPINGEPQWEITKAGRAAVDEMVPF